MERQTVLSNGTAVLRQLAFVGLTVFMSLGASQATPAAPTKVAPQLRDGSHDFDWEIGTWTTHLRVLLHHSDGSVSWVSYEGTSDVWPIWNCRANMVELKVDGPSGHIEALNLRLYNPKSHQWSLNFASVKDGIISVPTVGEFRNKVGVFYDQESIEGRTVLVRNVWSDITENSGHFEQAISDDGGKTWLANWVADDTRTNGVSQKCQKHG